MGLNGFLNDYIMIWDFANVVEGEDLIEVNRLLPEGHKIDYPEAGGFESVPENWVGFLVATEVVQNLGYSTLFEILKCAFNMLIIRLNNKRKAEGVTLPEYSISIPLPNCNEKNHFMDSVSISFKGNFNEEAQKEIIDKGIELLGKIIERNSEEKKVYYYNEDSSIFEKIDTRYNLRS